jgi:hypothetical protein
MLIIFEDIFAEVLLSWGEVVRVHFAMASFFTCEGARTLVSMGSCVGTFLFTTRSIAVVVIEGSTHIWCHLRRELLLVALGDL